MKSLYYAMGYGRTAQINKAFMFVTLSNKGERKKNQDQIMAEIRGKLRLIPGLKGTAENVSLIGGGQ